MKNLRRAEKLRVLEEWADSVTPESLQTIDTTALKTLLKLSDERHAVEEQLEAAVQNARSQHHSWSQIGAMLGVSKQAAQRKYAKKTTAA